MADELITDWCENKIDILIYSTNVITESTEILLRDTHKKMRNAMRTLVEHRKGTGSASLLVITRSLTQLHVT